MRLKNVLLVVSDIERSKRFYHELFRLQTIRDFGDNVSLSEGIVLQGRLGWEQLIGTHTVTGNASELFYEENNFDAFLLAAQEKKGGTIYGNDKWKFMEENTLV